MGVVIYVLYTYSKSRFSLLLFPKASESNFTPVIRYGFGQNIWDVDFPVITQFYKVRSLLSLLRPIVLTRCVVFSSPCCDVQDPNIACQNIGRSLSTPHLPKSHISVYIIRSHWNQYRDRYYLGICGFISMPAGASDLGWLEE